MHTIPGSAQKFFLEFLPTYCVLQSLFFSKVTKYTPYYGQTFRLSYVPFKFSWRVEYINSLRKKSLEEKGLMI